jgi:glutaredoxin 3
LEVILMVKVYSLAECPWCKKVKAYLNSKNIPFTNVDVEADANGREALAKLSPEMSVPVLDIDGQVIIGFDKERIDACLKL